MAKAEPVLITDIPRVIIVKMGTDDNPALAWQSTLTARAGTLTISEDDDYSEVVSSVGFNETPETTPYKSMGLRYIDNIVGSIDLEVEVNINGMDDEALGRLLDGDHGSKWAVALEFGSPASTPIASTRMDRFIVFVCRRFQNNMTMDADYNWSGSITYKGAQTAPLRR